MRMSSTNSSHLLWSMSGLMLLISFNFMMNTKTMLLEWELMTLNSTPLYFYIMLDPQGLILSSAVLFISANILHFSSFYMSDEKHLTRFIHLVLLFVLSMNLLIFIPHFMFLLLGWDGLGLTSFLLVIYYYSPKALGAGLITAFTNRIGDVLILISIGWCLIMGQWNIMNMWTSTMNWWLVLFITLAAMTKSAQIPFSSWLPAAMAAPTPVSALVHSSTLVTAGVFLLIRFYNFLSTMHFFNSFLLIMSSLTMCMAGLAALVESDLKKIIALSTLSQLGVMMASIALGLPNLALFHLITHALFKALLFVCAGSLIHLNGHSQDLRQVGEIMSNLPITSSCFLVSNLALCALPFMAGFYSKDLILEFSSFNHTNLFIMTLLSFATILTAAYSMRFLYIGWATMTLHSPLNSIKNEDPNATTPAMMLSLGAISGGAVLNWILIHPISEPMLLAINKLSPFIFTLLGLWSAFFISANYTSMSLILKTTSFSLSSMWFLVPMSSQMMISFPLKMSITMTKNLDQGWNEYYGGQGMKTLTSSLSFSASLPQKVMPTIHLTMTLFLCAPLILF